MWEERAPVRVAGRRPCALLRDQPRRGVRSLAKGCVRLPLTAEECAAQPKALRVPLFIHLQASPVAVRCCASPSPWSGSTATAGSSGSSSPPPPSPPAPAAPASGSQQASAGCSAGLGWLCETSPILGCLHTAEVSGSGSGTGLQVTCGRLIRPPTITPCSKRDNASGFYQKGAVLEPEAHLLCRCSRPP